MEKEFVPYDLALRLKELGFYEPCIAFYQVENFEKTPCGVDDKDEYIRTGFSTCKNSEIPEHFTSAPLYQQAFRWFREKYSLYTEMHKKFDGIGVSIILSEYRYDMRQDKEVEHHIPKYFGTTYKSYEEAELACLEKLIEIVEI
jgi:hypothetical protein